MLPLATLLWLVIPPAVILAILLVVYFREEDPE